MKKLIRKIRTELNLKLRFLFEAYHFWRVTCKYNASSNTDNDIEKMQYTLSRETHTIEKGMSLRDPRKGFGQEKVKNLIFRLEKYCSHYAQTDSLFLEYPLGTIKYYIEFTKKNGFEIPEIEKAFLRLVQSAGKTVDSITSVGGVTIETKQHIQELCDSTFENLLNSRHSLRYFSGEPVSKDSIIKALKLAQRTPSACNRQGWLTHVYKAPESISLVEWQGGSRGFENEIKNAILVTANLKAFLGHEIHQAYIDGGLYAMNLINALHSLGLGTIPLSCGFDYRKLQGLSIFGVKENEVPIVIIGFGYLLDEFKVAISERKDINITNTFH